MLVGSFKKLFRMSKVQTDRILDIRLATHHPHFGPTAAHLQRYLRIWSLVTSDGSGTRILGFGSAMD